MESGGTAEVRKETRTHPTLAPLARQLQITRDSIVVL